MKFQFLKKLIDSPVKSISYKEYSTNFTKPLNY